MSTKQSSMIQAVVFGNVTLDILCKTIDDVPRFESISFDHVVISPGGCASNVAVGLSNLGIKTALVCHIGKDDPGKLIITTWEKMGIDLRYVKINTNINTAVSVGLIDSEAQPRFIHTPGANAGLTVESFHLSEFLKQDVNLIHIAGFFVLPGLLDKRFSERLAEARSNGIKTSLDVVNSKRYWKAEYLIQCLPNLDYFFCNLAEATRLTGQSNERYAMDELIGYGAKNVIIKLGARGCFINGYGFSGYIPAPRVDCVVDTTGAGDGFAAGFIATILQGGDLQIACEKGNQIGSNIVQTLGTISFWETINTPASNRNHNKNRV